MKRFRIQYDILKQNREEAVWLSEIIEASDIEEALKQASILALKRRWNLNGVEEQ